MAETPLFWVVSGAVFVILSVAPVIPTSLMPPDAMPRPLATPASVG